MSIHGIAENDRADGKEQVMGIESNKEAYQMVKNTLGSIENRFREAYNKGYKDGLRDGASQVTAKLVSKILEEVDEERSE